VPNRSNLQQRKSLLSSASSNFVHLVADLCTSRRGICRGNFREVFLSPPLPTPSPHPFVWLQDIRLSDLAPSRKSPASTPVNSHVFIYLHTIILPALQLHGNVSDLEVEHDVVVEHAVCSLPALCSVQGSSCKIHSAPSYALRP
jgi:hypothetical protein